MRKNPSFIPRWIVCCTTCARYWESQRKKKKARRRKFWEKVYQEIEDKQLDTLQQHERDDGANNLLLDKSEKLFGSNSEHDEKLDGFIWPVNLEDIYGLYLGTSGRYLNAASNPPQKKRRAASSRRH